MLPQKLSKVVLVLLFLFLATGAVILGKEFLLPVAFALLFSMLLLKKAIWLESKGFPKWLAILSCLLLVMAVFAGVVYLIGWQISDLDTEISEVSRHFTKMQREAKQFIRETLGLSYKEANELVDSAAENGRGSKVVTMVLAVLTTIFTNSILIIVYVFLFLFFRTHLKKFALMLVPEEKKSNADIIIKDSIDIANAYISGMAKMIVCLWVMYGIGFGIVGIKNPIMFALICGTLEIVPFVGNLAGTLLVIIMVLVQDGSNTGMIIGVVAVYAVVQFVQTYILEPLVVGTQVNLNPLSTIVALVLGEILWGIPGMIIAIPMLGMAKILFDNVEGLKPYGFLLGQSDGGKKKQQIAEQLKKKIGRKNSS
jgi:predicted PurR-regulated permease PerM